MSGGRPEQQEPGTDREAILRAVERLALLFAEMGMQRMAGRVFAYVLIDDADRYTAGELAEGLRVSPAAISGAVRQLVSAGLLGKEREPGSRSDQYRIYDDDVWRAITQQSVAALQRTSEVTDECIAILGDHEPGARRLRETREYVAFMARELEAMNARWHAYREERFGAKARRGGGEDE